ncbi:snoRNA-binding rRNA-processing protein [Sorochytrium milnesiophthora]
MGKTKTASAAKEQRHDPLHVQMRKDTDVSLDTRRQRSKRSGKADEDATFVDAKTSKKILKLARQQQDELASENGPVQVARQHIFGSEAAHIDSDDDVAEDPSFFEENEEDWELDIDEEDKELLEKFFPSQPAQRQNLADIIAAKLSEFDSNGSHHQQQQQSSAQDESSAHAQGQLNPKVVEVFSKVGTLLSRYKSGKLPKAFKRISSLANWEEILYITRPDQWSDQAMYEATRIFVSSFRPKDAQIFLNSILLERFRDEIAETKKVNYHIFHALKKSMYKPAAFYKGILLPLCQSGTCTLREAAILSAVLTRVSIPVLHSSAALLKLAEMDYCGANSIFIRVLLDKKYALPFKVVDALVAHFLRFKHDSRQLPVLFHQSLLIFVQRYKQDITPEQKEALLDLIRVRGHPEIGPEIRRELVNSKCRGDMDTGSASAGGIFGTMEVQMVDA